MKSVLITGGSGSFGQAFARALLDRGVERVCVFSRGEHRQAEMREAFNNDSRLRWFIGDVRDRHRLTHAMKSCDVVIHAAALKRIEVCQYCPEEAIRTNVLGAVNVVEAAHDAGVDRVVGLSTDKAYQPVSPYGFSKALMESLFLAANYARGTNGPRFACTRYGNVWWSAGSVGPRWKALAATQTCLPVTDLRCTRFFMTMAEAVDLVMKTVDTMEGGELVIPDHLPAYQLGDLLEAFGAIGMEKGLAPHEKLHESMRDGESSETTRRMTVQELKEAIANVR